VDNGCGDGIGCFEIKIRADTAVSYHLSHPGQLGLAILPWIGAMTAVSSSESWEVNRHAHHAIH